MKLQEDADDPIHSSFPVLLSNARSSRLSQRCHLSKLFWLFAPNVFVTHTLHDVKTYGSQCGKQLEKATNFTVYKHYLQAL